jgi:hypothetical protein
LKNFYKATVYFALFLLLSIFNGQALAQEVVVQEYYGDVEVTDLAYYDPVMGAYVRVPVRHLPWWWDPLYLPLGWTLLTPAIVPVAIVEGCFFSGSTISFSSYSVSIVDVRYNRYRDHIRGLRDDWRQHHDRGFSKALREAHGKYGKDLKHPPPGFKHAGAKGHPGAGKPDGHPGEKGQAHLGDKGKPAPGKFAPRDNKAGPPPDRAGKGKTGPPPGKLGPPPGKTGVAGGKAVLPPPKKGESAATTGKPGSLPHPFWAESSSNSDSASDPTQIINLKGWYTKCRPFSF